MRVTILLLATILAGCASVPDPCAAPRTFPDAAPGGRIAADPGPDLILDPGEMAFLDGSDSFDLDKRTLKFHWDQLEGPCVVLDLTDQVRPTFEAPTVPDDGAILKFRLIVQAGDDYSRPSQVTVYVGRGEMA